MYFNNNAVEDLNYQKGRTKVELEELYTQNRWAYTEF